MKIWPQSATLLQKSIIQISRLWDVIATRSSRFEWWLGQGGGWRRRGRGGQQVGKWGGQWWGQ